MDLSAGAGVLDELEERVASADVVVPEGSRTQWAVGGTSAEGVLVSAPADHVHHDPADLTVSVDAGVTVATLDATLARAGQECPIDPRDDAATVGGAIVCGLSGHRRLKHGPLRDRVLGVEVVLGDGRRVRGGGPTVKNVTGYDLPRLLVGSLGTLGLVTRLTLRCVPVAPVSWWGRRAGDPFELRRRLYAPASLAWDGADTWCLLEGHEVDVEVEAAAGELVEAHEPPWPAGAVRARISVRPRMLSEIGPALAGIDGLRWLAEAGVGTVHVAADAPGPIEAARRLATEHGGHLLLEEGEGVDPFGTVLPNGRLMRRIREALDPAAKMNPGRLPL